LWVLHYFNWAGSNEQFKEFVNIIKSQFARSDRATFLGFFIPTSEWQYVAVWDLKSYETVLQIYKSYSEKFGALKMSLGKVEIFHTFEEIPFL
jgi:hypothetical protein